MDIADPDPSQSLRPGLGEALFSMPMRGGRQIAHHELRREGKKRIRDVRVKMRNKSG
jgi:hypothetical protein